MQVDFLAHLGIDLLGAAFVDAERPFALLKREGQFLVLAGGRSGSANWHWISSSSGVIRPPMGSLDVEPPGAEKPPIGVFPAQVVAAGIEPAPVE